MYCDVEVRKVEQEGMMSKLVRFQGTNMQKQQQKQQSQASLDSLNALTAKCFDCWKSKKKCEFVYRSNHIVLGIHT
jgi:hypothetical protein